MQSVRSRFQRIRGGGGSVGRGTMSVIGKGMSRGGEEGTQDIGYRTPDTFKKALIFHFHFLPSRGIFVKPMGVVSSRAY